MARRRRRPRYLGLLAAAALLVSFGAWLALGSNGSNGDPARADGRVRIEARGRILAEREARELKAWTPARLERWLATLPQLRRERQGRTRLTLRTDRRKLLQRVNSAVLAGGGTIQLPARTVASYVSLPVLTQALRNNCETAALSMLLATDGIRARQLVLQRQLPRSGPLDPIVEPASDLPLWGDPSTGYVGRAEGGGTSGGYGVYEPPIKALAAKHGAKLITLSRRSPRTIYRHLLTGRPIMVWVGLSDGPVKTWRTTSGKHITGNFGEHTVVLTGLRGERLLLNDPLIGRRSSWTRNEFEQMWNRLGRRALAL